MIATTRGALFRGTTTDALGDEVDDNTEALLVDGEETRRHDDFPVSIIERDRQEFDEASNAWRTVRRYYGRHSIKIPTKAGDRIRDNRTGEFYVVDEAERTLRGVSGRSSVSLTMKRSSP